MSKKTQREIELEALLLQRDSELNDYRNRLTEASRAIAEYKNREASIVGALTEAHASSRRIMDEAMLQRDSIVAEAQQHKNAMDAEAQSNLAQAQQTAAEIISNAQSQATAIIENANEEANGIIGKAQQEYADCISKVNLMNERVTATAEDASRRLEEFRSTFVFEPVQITPMEFPVFDSKPVFESEPVFAVSQTAEQFIPVENAAPVFEAEPQAPQTTQSATAFFNDTAAQSPVQDTFSVQDLPPVDTSFPVQDVFTAQDIPPVSDKFAIHDELPVQPQFFGSAPSPFAEPMQEPIPIPAAAESDYYAAQSQNFYQNLAQNQQQNQTGKVWTVDEILNQPQSQPQFGTASNEVKKPSGFDAELDAIINDILN